VQIGLKFIYYWSQVCVQVGLKLHVQLEQAKRVVQCANGSQLHLQVEQASECKMCK
jgi:hypothetical protein